MKKPTWKKAMAFLLLTNIILLGLTGCGNNSRQNTQDTAFQKESKASEKDLKPLRIGTGGRADSPALYLASAAKEKGYLEEELNKIHYTLELSSFAGAGPEINEALAAGELDGAVYGEFPAFTSKSNGIDTKIIAVVNGQQQYAVLSSKNDIKTAKDLEGKRVIVPLGTVTQFFWDSYARARGIDIGSVELINAVTDAESLLQTGDADAYVMIASSLYSYEAKGLGKVIDTGSDIPEASTEYVFTLKSDLTDACPELPVAINKALIRAFEDIQKNPQLLYDSTASEYLSAEYSKMDYAFDPSLAFMSPEITEKSISHFQEVKEWMKAQGILQNDVDISTFAVPDYYKQAKEALINIENGGKK